MSSAGLVDYHLHTAVAVDAHTCEAQVCQRAVALGLREIAFTNHVMLRYPDYYMSAPDLVNHWSQIQVCQARFPDLTIRLGLELDYYTGHEEQIAATVQHYLDLIGRRFDYVLGAVHHLNGVFFGPSQNAPALFNQKGADAIYRDYFALMTQAVQSGLFDVMAHPDLIKHSSCSRCTCPRPGLVAASRLSHWVRMHTRWRLWGHACWMGRRPCGGWASTRSRCLSTA